MRVLVFLTIISSLGVETTSVGSETVPANREMVEIEYDEEKALDRLGEQISLLAARANINRLRSMDGYSIRSNRRRLQTSQVLSLMALFFLVKLFFILIKSLD
jgi:hypothetical protein